MSAAVAGCVHSLSLTVSLRTCADRTLLRRLVAINVAAELAAERADVQGPSTFRAALIDECFRLTPDDLAQRAKVRKL